MLLEWQRNVLLLFFGEKHETAFFSSFYFFCCFRIHHRFRATTPTQLDRVISEKRHFFIIPLLAPRCCCSVLLISKCTLSVHLSIYFYLGPFFWFLHSFAAFAAALISVFSSSALVCVRASVFHTSALNISSLP